MTAAGTGPEDVPPGGHGSRAQLVVLVRHGETEWSRTGKHTGRVDVPLDPAGEEQARWIERRLHEWHFAQVLTSPLLRARRTCEIAGFAAVAQVDADAQEWDYGQYEGRTTDDIRLERPGWNIWHDGVVGGETIEDVGRRAERVMGRIQAVTGDVALFAHGHFLRILTTRWCGLPERAGEHLDLSAGAVSVLGFDRESPVIWRWNDTSHLSGGHLRW